MNKYMNFYNKISELAHEELGESDFKGLTKSLIANELNYILCWDEHADLRITDEQQETIIEMTYNEYMDFDGDCSIYNATKAMMNVFDKFGNFEEFYNYYENDYCGFRDDFVFNI